MWRAVAGGGRTAQARWRGSEATPRATSSRSPARAPGLIGSGAGVGTRPTGDSSSRKILTRKIEVPRRRQALPREALMRSADARQPSRSMDCAWPLMPLSAQSSRGRRFTPATSLATSAGSRNV